MSLRTLEIGLFLIIGLVLGSSARGQEGAGRVTLENPLIAVSVEGTDGTIQVLDKRTKQTWGQKVFAKDMVAGVSRVGERVICRVKVGGLEVGATIQVEKDRAEFTVALSGEGAMGKAVAFPQPFVTEKGTYLVIPMNEGISFPVEDESIRPMWLIAYGGHGICMGFFGATDGERGYMAILETPDDATIRIERREGVLCVVPQWDAQKGKLGYERRIRYVFFERGGHVAMAKRYRAHARQVGLLKTLAEKRKQNANVDKLIGAANVWFWEKDPVGMVKELQGAGIERILWSNQASPAAIREMNELGVLTSRYDIYQDVMDPGNFKNLRGVHPDWTTEGWPRDLMIGAKGDWVRGWEVRGKDGKMYPCGVLCDKPAPAYAEKRIGEELKTHAYGCRFIDTTTASPWRECYHPDHPMTRTESRKYKMELLGRVCDGFNLVTGCETGHEAAVPVVHYFEGMMSLGPYRVPDSGRDIQRIWTEVPEAVAKFQLGERYRLPLWELVYHDCVVATWYWGDYNNKLPAVWEKRDLFNVLYGTPPMFMFDRELWKKEKERFVKSYRATCSVAREVGYSEMVDHRFLTADRSVQQTRFANGVVVTVNFGEKAWVGDGVRVEAGGYEVEGGGGGGRPKSEGRRPNQ